MGEHGQLQVGMETFARRASGEYHVGDVLQIDEQKEASLIAFDDGTEAWCSFKDIQNASVCGPDIVCCLCQEGNSQHPNEIVLCDLCGLGFHQQCHNPAISSSVLEPDIEWICRLCHFVQEKNAKLTSPERAPVGSTSNPLGKTLPYQLNELNWDRHHLINEQNKYCYCGKPGTWYVEMLECKCCHQWFHQECTVRARAPLLVWGDRYCVFVCAVCCTQGEQLQRLAIGWEEVVHLALFHLTMAQNLKYLDVYDVIVPWVVQNLHRFMLPQSLQETPKDDMKDIIVKALECNANRFKSGREIKKRWSWWGLRERYPPVPPTVDIVNSGDITEETVTMAISKALHSNQRPKEPSAVYPVIPFRFVSKKRKASTDGSEICPNKPKKPRKKSLPNKPKVVLSATTSEKSVTITPDLKAVVSTHNNNNNDSPAKISLDRIIPRPTSYDGLNHPFKTILERNQEIATTKLKEQLLGSFTTSSLCNGETGSEGLDTEDSCVDTGSDSTSLSHIDSTEPHKNLSRSLSHLPKIKRKKRGRPSKAEIQALEARMAAAMKLGIKDKSYIIQSKSPVSSQPGTPRAAEKKPRTKNVVDKSTLDGMSEREVSMTQLRTSVNAYFGAANRLATGEGFRVVARRVSPEGRVQYLVEWEGGIIG